MYDFQTWRILWLFKVLTSTCLASWNGTPPYLTSGLININTVPLQFSPLPDSDQSDRQLHWKVGRNVQLNAINCLLKCVQA